MTTKLTRADADSLNTQITAGYAPTKQCRIDIYTYGGTGQSANRFWWHPGLNPDNTPTLYLATSAGAWYWRNADGWKTHVTVGYSVNKLIVYPYEMNALPGYYACWPYVCSGGIYHWWEWQEDYYW